MAQIASLLVPGVNIPQYDGSSWLATLGNALEERGQKKEARQLVQESFGGVAPQQQGGFLSNLKGMVTGQQPSAPNGGFLSRLSGQTTPARAPQTVNVSGDKATFVNALLPAAIEESKRTGVDPRLIVAQAAQETGWGKSAPGNNYFGIKSHGQGGGQNLTTHEVINGQRVKINDSFRTFESPAHSVRGYGDFLLQNPRYRQLREAQGLDNQVAALQASGYATDPNYGNSVGAIARSIQLPAEQPQTAADAIEAIAPLNGAPTPQVAPQAYAADAGWMTYDQKGARVERSTLSDSAPGAISQQNFDDRFGPVPLPSETPAQGVDGLRAGLEQQPPAAPAGIAAATPPATYQPPAPAPQSAPVQVADASGTVGYSAPPAPAAGSPVQVNADLLGRMVTNPYTRDMGIALWKTTVEGRKQGYDFMMTPDGTLLRTDKAGNFEAVGNFAKPATTGSGSSEYGLTPQYGVDAQGNPVLIQLGKDGQGVQTALPPGVKLSKEPIKLDAGTHFVLLDPITRQAVGTIPKENRQEAADKAGGTVEGRTAAERTASASGDAQAAQNALDLLADIRNDPYRPRGTGMTSVLNAVPGTGGYDFNQKVEQAKSGAFLSAIQQMRGLGALSNTEGQAATAAITRMNASMSEEGFLAALDDYEKIVRQAMARAQSNLPEGGSLPDAGSTRGPRPNGQPARPASDDDYNALPSGSLFIDPDDGKTYRKP